ncbi:MAG TPA: hypothetical protein VEC38_13080 [Candidatus Binataceae bacterium]|nr:hypothetical protein [Candidatus Binataceae bacterium]
MRKLSAAAAALVLALSARTAVAGVVITQEQTVNSGANERKVPQSVMVEGNKEKMVTGPREIITDLDKGALYVVEPATKTYLEFPFPPTGQMAHMVSRQSTMVDFKKGTTTRTVAGYTCDDYTGSAGSMGGNFTITECFSKNAPGAKEFSAFQKNMAAKLKDTPMAPPSEVPDGIPLASNSEMKPNSFTPPAGMNPEQAQRIRDMLAKHGPITMKTTVTKIEVKKLPADTFTVPAGFTKREVQMPAMSPMGGVPMGKPPAAAGAPAPAPAPPAAPEAH